MRVAHAHFCTVENTGDLVSRPSLYFELPGGPLVPIGQPTDTPAVIYGGGAVARALPELATRRPGAVHIAWGVGGTWHGRKEPGSVVRGFALYGSRDAGQSDAEWVPCVSCMSPLFDQAYQVTREAVLFVNADPSFARPVIEGLPVMTNDRPFEEIVAFLGSAETVVTNSYHGAYWGVLLGKRVVIRGAYSSKFFNYRHQPPVDDGRSWRCSAVRCPVWPEGLIECREANVAFHRKVLAVLDGIPRSGDVH